MGGIERDERNVSLVNIEKIARAFKVTLSQLCLDGFQRRLWLIIGHGQ